MNGEWQPTYGIDNKSRVMADACKCQKHYVTTDLQIFSENRVTVDHEIVNEYWETALTNSGPTHQIDSKNKAKVDAWNCQERYVLADP
jgi:hypothetical protein